MAGRIAAVSLAFVLEVRAMITPPKISRHSKFGEGVAPVPMHLTQGQWNLLQTNSSLEPGVSKHLHHQAAASAKQLPLVPYPTSVKMSSGSSNSFDWAGDIEIETDKAVPSDALGVAALRDLVNSSNWNWASKRSSTGTSSSVISLKMDGSLKADGYTLQIEENRMEIVAADAGGLYYAVQTLQQLLRNSENMQLQALHIQDSPAFSWRGLHLDCARHFFAVPHVKKLLDTMAAFKMNRFHWHLTDDQGWRLPVESYPKLTASGDSYTAEEIRDVVDYAAARNIEVIPEVDVPGHAAAAVAAYPELGNTDYAAPDGPLTDWGMFQWTLSPTNTSKQFLVSILDTLVELFPSKRIHMGGDEAPGSQWEGASSDARQSWILPDNFDGRVQTVFNQWLGEMLHERGRTLAGWDEMQLFGMRSDSTVFAWRSSRELDLAVASGRSAVCSDSGFTYFDYIQGNALNEPKGQPNVVVLQTVYDRCKQFAQKWAGNPLVLGAQGQLWSEYIETPEHLQYMAFPRSLALADCLWSNDAGGSYDQFVERLRPQLENLRQDGVKFHEL